MGRTVKNSRLNLLLLYLQYRSPQSKPQFAYSAPRTPKMSPRKEQKSVSRRQHGPTPIDLSLALCYCDGNMYSLLEILLSQIQATP